MKTYAPSLTKSFAVANPIPSVPPVTTAILPSSFLAIVSLRCCWVATFQFSKLGSLDSDHGLAEVIGQMVGAAQQDGEAIARSIFREIFFRYGRVSLEPVGPRHFLKPLRQFTVYGFPCLANLFVRRNGGLGLVGIGYEGDIKLGMKPISQPQQRQHRVMHGREMSPQVKQPVSARHYFPQDLLGREASKKLVRPLDLRLPHLQRESHIRAFVCHSSVSSHLYIGKLFPNMGAPLSDCSSVASSCITSKCSTSNPSSTRKMSAAIQFTGEASIHYPSVIRPRPERSRRQACSEAICLTSWQ